MNTRITYLYRDGANYKAWGAVVVVGDLRFSDVEPYLESGNYFIPHEVGLPELQSQMRGFPTPDDHVWHEISEDSFEFTSDPPTDGLSAGELLERFKKASKNVPAAMERLGLAID